MVRVLVPRDALGADWGPNASVIGYDQVDPGDLVNDPADVLVVGYGPHDAAFLLADRLPRLRYLQTTYAGVETWQERLAPEVVLGNTGDAFAAVTAELATGGLIALLRGLQQAAEQQRAGHWELIRGETVSGRRAVVVGAGHVASMIRRQLEALGAQVTLVGRAARGDVRAVEDLPTLVADADVLVLAVPLTDATRGLVNAELLAGLPDQAVLVNVARGQVVVTEALVAELATGRLRAVLDVTDPEPLPSNHPLWHLPGVLLTPHVGGAVDSAINAGVAEAARHVAAYCAGETPQSLVERTGPRCDRFSTDTSTSEE